MLRVFSAFAGYGTDNFALKLLQKKHNIPFECVGYSEVDKWAIKCFEQNHSIKLSCDVTGNLYSDKVDRFIEKFDCYKIIPPRNYGDITKINPDDLPNFDLFTGGFPCQAFSVAGKGLGELDPRGTLFYDIIRICEVKKPKYIFLENVKGLLSKKHKETFNKIISELERIGYQVDWQVLNTKHYGIPQNRERVFFVCQRKDIRRKFTFPEKEELNILIKDILEPEPVDAKYYLKPHQVERLLKQIETKFKGQKYTCISPYGGFKSNETSGTMGAGVGVRNSKTEQIVLVSTDNVHQHSRVYDSVGVAPTLGTNKSPSIVVHSLQPRSENRPSFKKAKEEGRPYPGGYGHLCKEDGTSYCLDTTQTQAIEIKGLNVVPNVVPKFFDLYNHCFKDICPTLTDPKHNPLRLYGGSRFRKLTPKECFRLQGFLKDEINLEGLSDTQAYKLAGNGQSVNVVYKIFEELLT